MNIAYITARPLQINASSSIRNYSTIMGLKENGHSVTVISTKPDKRYTGYDETMVNTSLDIRYVELKKIHNITILCKKMWCINQLKKVYMRILQRREIYDSLKEMADHVDAYDLNEYDLVISSSDPKSSHLYVDRYYEKKGKKNRWIQIWGDPFLNDISRENNLSKLIEREEARLLAGTDDVIYVSELSCIEQKRKYSKYASKMRYLPIPFLEFRRENRPFPKEMSRISLCYCGDYYTNVRNIIPLYNAVDKLKMHLTIYGNSNLKLNCTESIVVKQRQALDEVRSKEKEADVLVHLSNKEGTQIPGKIYQYTSTDKPILFILDGDCESIRKMFGKYNRFLFVNNCEEEIENALKNIRTLVPLINNNPIEEFLAKNIAKEIIEQT